MEILSVSYTSLRLVASYLFIVLQLCPVLRKSFDKFDVIFHFKLQNAQILPPLPFSSKQI